MVALVTPFTDDGSAIDEARLEQHINWLIDCGVHGLVPGGSTGEFPSLSSEERKNLHELVVKFTKGRVPVVAGTGALTTKESIELAKHAAQIGVDAVMVVPPFYDTLSYAELKELLNEVHKASGLPIMFYNLPAVTGMKLSPAEIADLSAVGVKYMKDTSGDAPALTELLFTHQNEITAFNGWDTLTFYGLAAGAKGSVWGATNIIPELSIELWNAVAVKGDLKRGRELWVKIMPVCKFLENGNYAAAVKTGMELRGIKTGGLRKPFSLLSSNETKDFAKILEKAEVKVAQ